MQKQRLSGRERLIYWKEPGPMKSNSGHAEHAIERILELSANAQITRRMVPKDSPAFHNLTGAIAAYGKALALLTALQQREEFYTIVAAAA